MEWDLHYRRFCLPFRTPVRTAHGLWTEREGLLLRLESEAGEVRLGEAAPIPEFGTETVEEDEAGVRALGGRIDERLVAQVPARLACLRHALDMAFAEAPEAGAEAPDYLGVAALLPAGRPALAQVAARLESGFRVFKWKVGVGDVADELALLDDLCAALPTGARLRLDANGAWDRRRAERWLERCADRPVEFVEQPIAAEARAEMDLLLGLANDYPTPLALDESLIGEHDVERWLGAGWPGVYVVKPTLLPRPADTLARLGQARATVVFSSALETAVGAQAALRHAFAWRPAGATKDSPPPALGFGVWPLFADGRCDGPAAAPFIRREDVERLDPHSVWTALS